MKGKLYNSEASLRTIETQHSPSGVFTYNKERKIKHKLSFRSKGTDQVQYYWESSLSKKPELALEQRLSKINQKYTKNSIAFLEQTHKYIHQLNKPIVFTEKSKAAKKLSPRKTSTGDESTSKLNLLRKKLKRSFDSLKLMRQLNTYDLGPEVIGSKPAKVRRKLLTKR